MVTPSRAGYHGDAGDFDDSLCLAVLGFEKRASSVMVDITV